jgi:DNA-binding transcriptional MocR family regulator
VTGRTPQPGLGSLPEEWLDVPAVGRCLRLALTDLGTGHTTYGDPGGDPVLRTALAGRLHELGVRAGPEQVITTVGATHALDIVARTLLRPGDAVFVDDPGWSVEFARLEALGARLVPRLEDGPDLGLVERVLAASPAADRPRLFVTSSVLHNPTSQSMSMHAAHRLLSLARDYDMTVVEDDVHGYLAPASTPRLATLDGLERTVYISGFSKILAPGWRIGYVAVPPALVARLTDAKLMTSLATPSLLERAMVHCMEGGHLRRHADRIRRRLDEERQKVVALVRRNGWTFASAPDGLFGWVDVGVDTEAVAALLAPGGWVIAPGALFDPYGKSSTRLRLNFATSADPAFFTALAAAVREGAGDQHGRGV